MSKNPEEFEDHRRKIDVIKKQIRNLPEKTMAEASQCLLNGKPLPQYAVNLIKKSLGVTK